MLAYTEAGVDIEKGEAIANALMVSSKLCCSKPFQLMIKPLFSKRDLRSLKINFKSENCISSFLFSKHARPQSPYSKSPGGELKMLKLKLFLFISLFIV